LAGVCRLWKEKPMRDTATDAPPSGATPSAFLFIANALALDLVNTDVILRRRRRDLLPTPEALAQWWEIVRSHYPGLDLPSSGTDARWRSEVLLEATKRLRAALHALFLTVMTGQPVSSAAIEPLNQILRLGYRRLEISAAGEVLPGYGVHQDGVGALLLPIALSAYELLTEAERGRLRACENPHCVALFYDTSKSATRRWCSESCMNRARSAERYAQTKRAHTDA
jgi:predicted RNA-binding Zn ribbon-like protein